MNRLSNKELLAILSFLLIVFLLSFCGSLSSGGRQRLRTALLNPSHKDELTSVELSIGSESLLLEKKDGIWCVKKESLNFYTLAAQDRAEAFVNELVKIVTLYKISDNLPKKNTFGFDSPSAFRIKCLYGPSSSEYLFGNQDFARTSRYLLTGKSTGVYQLSGGIEKYLTVSPSFWSEPRLISDFLVRGLSAQSIQRIELSKLDGGGVRAARILTPADGDFLEYANSLLELRHGGLFDSEPSAIGEQLLSLALETGDKNQVLLKAFATDEEGLFALQVLYKDRDFTATLRISEWTLARLVKGVQK